MFPGYVLGYRTWSEPLIFGGSSGAMYQPVFDHVREAANKDESNRKLFLHGLTWDSTSDGVKRALAGYGEVESCHVIMEKSTGKSKGFGFVTFKDMDAANAVLEVARREALSIDVRMRVRLSCARAALRVCTMPPASEWSGRQTLRSRPRARDGWLPSMKRHCVRPSRVETYFRALLSHLSALHLALTGHMRCPEAFCSPGCLVSPSPSLSPCRAAL